MAVTTWSRKEWLILLCDGKECFLEDKRRKKGATTYNFLCLPHLSHWTKDQSWGPVVIIHLAQVIDWFSMSQVPILPFQPRLPHPHPRISPLYIKSSSGGKKFHPLDLTFSSEEPSVFPLRTTDYDWHSTFLCISVVEIIQHASLYTLWFTVSVYPSQVPGAKTWVSYKTWYCIHQILWFHQASPD